MRPHLMAHLCDNQLLYDDIFFSADNKMKNKNITPSTQS